MLCERISDGQVAELQDLFGMLEAGLSGLPERVCWGVSEASL